MVVVVVIVGGRSEGDGWTGSGLMVDLIDRRGGILVWYCIVSPYYCNKCMENKMG